MSEYIQNMFGYDGQTVVVIGGAGELGGALCRAFAQAGANVVVADVTEAGCKKRVAELESLGGKAFWTLIDVTKRESIVNALDEAKKPTGRVDVLVNAAGVNFASPTFLEHPEEKWDFVININLKGTFLSCQVFGEHTAAARSSISDRLRPCFRCRRFSDTARRRQRFSTCPATSLRTWL